MGIDTSDPDNFPDAVELQAGFEECDGFRHFYISPTMWKLCQTDVDIIKEDGEYLYWHGASWLPGGYGPWYSIRDWVASCVEQVEGMVEKGKKCGDDD